MSPAICKGLTGTKKKRKEKEMGPTKVQKEEKQKEHINKTNLKKQRKKKLNIETVSLYIY